ncbi:MAG: WD40 repeat domain-containing protein [Anaerolineae bacterium]|nr:WD40 repeat domain-containing protein [Anaerolineae bacterium]
MKIDTSSNSSTDHVPDVTEDADDLQSLSHPLSAQDQRMCVQNRRLRWLAAALALISVVLVAIVLSQIRSMQQTQDSVQVIQSTAMSEANVRTTTQAEARIWQAEAEAAGATVEALHTEVEIPQAMAEPEQQAQIALARYLTLEGRYIFDNSPAQSPLALLLAVESLRRYPERAADQLVADGLALLPREVARLTHEMSVIAVALSPDGRWAVSGSYDGTARVWEVETGREIARMPHQMWVTAVTFSPDGRVVVSGSDDDTVRVWEAETGREVTRISHKRSITAVAFSPDGQRVIFGSEDGTVVVLETATGQEVARTRYAGIVRAVTYSADELWVVTTSYDDTTARVWEASTGHELVQMPHDNGIGVVTFSLDRRWIASGSTDGTARVWEVATGREVARLTHNGTVTAVAFSPDGQWVISGDWGGMMRMWEVTTGHEVARMVHDEPVNAVAFSADGRWVVSGCADDIARAWDMSSLRNPDGVTIREIALKWPAYISMGGQWVAVSHCDEYDDLYEKHCVRSSVRVWDWETFASATGGREALRIMYDRAPGIISLSADGRWLTSAYTDTIYVYDVEASIAAAAGYEVARLQGQPLIIVTAVSPDGQRVAYGNGDGVNSLIEMWEIATGNKVMHEQMSIEGWPKILTFSPDGRKFAAAGCGQVSYREGCISGFVQVWDLETFPPRKVQMMKLDTQVLSVAFSPDGRWIASGSTDGMAWVWDVESGREVSRMIPKVEGAYQAVNAVAFSPDGQWVVSGSWNGVARVWEAATGCIVAEMTHKSAPVSFVAFSSDDQRVVSVFGWEGIGSVRIWRWQSEDMIDLACGRLTRNLTREEWRQYLGDEPYRATCPNLPEAPAGNE